MESPVMKFQYHKTIMYDNDNQITKIEFQPADDKKIKYCCNDLKQLTQQQIFRISAEQKDAADITTRRLQVIMPLIVEGKAAPFPCSYCPCCGESIHFSCLSIEEYKPKNSKVNNTKKSKKK